MPMESFRTCQRQHDVELIGSGLYAFVTCYSNGKLDFKASTIKNIPFKRIEEDFLKLGSKLGLDDPQIKWVLHNKDGSADR